MLVDGRLLPLGARLRSDVVIVGAGPAGLTLAQTLAAQGWHVTILEAGGRRHERKDDDALKGVCVGEPFPLVASRGRGFGGSSNRWAPGTGLRVRPFDACDFGASPLRDVRWPFERAALESYYEGAYGLISVTPEVRPEAHFGARYPSPLTWEGGPELALFQFADRDVFEARFDAVARARNIQLVLHATVVEIELADEPDAVQRLRVVAPDGNAFSAEGRFFVLAAGGIENARMLLESPGRYGNGVGNEHDNVGRYFMDHVSFDCAVVEPVGPEPFDGKIFEETWDERLGKRQAMLWLGEERIQREGLLNAAFWLCSAERAYLSPGVSAARALRSSTRAGGFVASSRHAVETLRHATDLAALRLDHWRGRKRLFLRVLAEQVPQRSSRITLSSLTDGAGRRRVRLDWRVAKEDLDSMRRHCALLYEQLERSGKLRVTKAFDPEEKGAPPLQSNYHHLGSTRMHVDPRLGVVDPELRVHSTKNLYVVGGSVVPAGGYLNPTLTILALALRLAHTLERALAVPDVQSSARSGVRRLVEEPDAPAKARPA